MGDAIEYPHPVDGRPWMNYLAGPANRQARIVADNMALGDRVRYEGSIGTSVAKVFGLTVAATGLAAKRLRQEDVPYLTATVHPNSPCGLLSRRRADDHKSGVLACRRPSVGCANRWARRRGQAHRPACPGDKSTAALWPTSHAWSMPMRRPFVGQGPVAVAGYVAENILTGRMRPVYWREMEDLDLAKVTLVDVRTHAEFAHGGIAGAVNIPLDELRGQLHRIPADRPVVVYCAVGLRGYPASNILRGHGYDVRNLVGESPPTPPPWGAKS